MTDKKKANPEAGPNNILPSYDSSTLSQRNRLLKRLQIESLDTLFIRSELIILAPAARIKELRKLGHQITSRRISVTDEHGRTHSGIALYTLTSNAVGGAAHE